MVAAADAFANASERDVLDVFLGKKHGYLAGLHDGALAAAGADFLLSDVAGAADGFEDGVEGDLALSATNSLVDDAFSQGDVGFAVQDSGVGDNGIKDSLQFAHAVRDVFCDVLEYVVADDKSVASHLTGKNCLTQIIVGTLNLSYQSAFETGDEAVFHTLQRRGRTVARHDYLAPVLVQMVEDVEECVLRLFRADKFLHVIKEKDINGLVEVDEVGQRVLAYGVHKLHLEKVGRDVENAFLRIEFLDAQADGIDEVGFAHTAGTIDEQRVENGAAWVVGNTIARSSRKSVAFTFDEVIEAVIGAEHPA